MGVDLLVAAAIALTAAQDSVSAGMLMPWRADGWDRSAVVNEVCRGLTDWSACSDQVEARCLALYPSVRRVAEGLVITLSSGGQVAFEENDSDGDSRVIFRYLGMVDGLPFHLALTAGNEWREYLAVNARTGQRTVMDSFPSVAPNHKKLATARIAAGGDPPPRLQIWAVEGDSLIIEAELQGNALIPSDSTIVAWGVRRPFWISDEKIRVEVVATRRGPWAPFDTTAVFGLRNGTWTLH